MSLSKDEGRKGTDFLSREMRKSIYYLPATDAERKLKGEAMLVAMVF